MKVVLDTSVLVFLVSPNAPAPIDPATGKHVEHCQERIEGLLEDLDKSGVQLLVPTPVLSELLIQAKARQIEVLGALANKRAVQVVPFDQAAAVENAALRRSKISAKTRGESKKEVSFDLQILAIARVAGAKMILSDDDQMRKRAVKAGMEVHGISDLDLPDSKRQIGLFFEPPSGDQDGDAGTEQESDDDQSNVKNDDQNS